MVICQNFWNAPVPSNNPELDFDVISDVFIEFLSSNNLETPLNIGVFGEWGIGKSTLMKKIELDFNAKNLAVNEKKILTIWFNAWEYQDESYIWAPLGNHILKVIEDMDTDDSSKTTKISKVRKAIELKDMKFGPYIKDITKTRLPCADKAIKVIERGANAIKESKQQKDPNFSVSFSQYFSEISILRSKFEEVIQDANIRLLVFIDDIDRISDPEKALEILEGLHLFLSVKNTVFILAISLRVLKIGLKKRYSSLLTDNNVADEDYFVKTYLDKIIQVPFTIPKYSLSQFSNFIQKYIGKYGNFDVDILNEISNFFELNPRWIKRLGNLFQLSKSLENKRRKKQGLSQLNDSKLLKVLVLQMKWEKFTQVILNEQNAFWDEEDTNIDKSDLDVDNVINFLSSKPSLVNVNATNPDDKVSDLIEYLQVVSINKAKDEENLENIPACDKIKKKGIPSSVIEESNKISYQIISWIDESGSTNYGRYCTERDIVLGPEVDQKSRRRYKYSRAIAINPQKGGEIRVGFIMHLVIKNKNDPFFEDNNFKTYKFWAYKKIKSLVEFQEEFSVLREKIIPLLFPIKN